MEQAPDSGEKGTGLHFRCERCREPINEPGGLLFSPPTGASLVVKTHICADCYRIVIHDAQEHALGIARPPHACLDCTDDEGVL